MSENEIEEGARLPQITRLTIDNKKALGLINFALDCSGNTTVAYAEEPDLSVFIDCFDIFGDACLVCSRKSLSHSNGKYPPERKVGV